MSYRLTFILLIILVAAGGYAFLLRGDATEDTTPTGPQARFFYDLDRDLIDRITLTYFDRSQTFVRNAPGDWRFDSKDGPKTSARFAGTNLLASGGSSQRLITDRATQERLEEYGLINAPFQMDIGLETGDTWCVRMGKTTPDAQYNYGQVQGRPCAVAFQTVDPNVYLMPEIWSEVLAEFVTNPPIPETPTPAPTQQVGT
jgi:hypothetical protein